MIDTNMSRSDVIKKLVIPALCVVDILMFPYLRALSCSLSMLIVLIWCIINCGSIPLKNTLFIVIPMVVVSVAVGFFVYNTTKGISTAVLVIYSMLLFYFISQFYTSRLKDILSIILFAYITLVFAMAILYIIAPQTYFTVRSFWTMNNTKIEFTSLIINRFTFIYSDPNNAGCALTAIYAYVLICEKHKMWKYIYYIIALGISVLITMSVQAVGMFAVVSLAILFLDGQKYRVVKQAMRRVIIVGLIAVILVGSTIFSNSALVDSIFDRLFGANFSTAGGRMSYWTKTITNALVLENIFIGKGAVIDSAGNTYLPHSGNLYMTISYGLITNIAYVITMFVLPRFAKKRYYIVLLPLMMIFTINTGISDYRFISLMAVLSAVLHKQAVLDNEYKKKMMNVSEESVFSGKVEGSEELV